MGVKCWKCENEIQGNEFFHRLKKNKEEDYDDDNFAEEESYWNDKLIGKKPVDYSNMRKYCEACYNSIVADREKDLQEYLRLKTKIMTERAIRILERQNLDVYEYEEAIKSVAEYAIDKPDKFMSSHEMIAAVILIYNRVETKIQFKIGKHAVDFYLPTLKAVLEVDGYMHDFQAEKDSKRDIDVRSALGGDWEVVRIPTKYIEQNAKVLVDAIVAVKEEKQKLRKQNNGILPETYSKREKTHYAKLALKENKNE